MFPEADLIKRTPTPSPSPSPLSDSQSPLQPPTYHRALSARSSTEMAAKRQKVAEPESHWAEDTFVCVHQNPESVSTEAPDLSLIRSILTFVKTNGCLRVAEVKTAFPGMESEVIRTANVLAAMKLLFFFMPEGGNPMEGLYLLTKDDREVEDVNVNEIIPKSVCDSDKQEYDVLKKRVERLETLIQR